MKLATAKLQQKIERMNAIEKFKKQFISGEGAAPRLSRRSRRRFCKLPVVEKRQTPSTICSTSIATASLLSARRLSSSASFAKILEQKDMSSKKSSSPSTRIALSNNPPPPLPEPTISLLHSARAKGDVNAGGTVVVSTVSDKSDECANVPPADSISEVFLCIAKDSEDLKAGRMQDMIDLQLEPPQQDSLSMIVQATSSTVNPPLKEIRDEVILPEMPVEAAILDQAMPPVVFSWQESQDIRGQEFLKDDVDAADPNPYTSLFAESQDISRPCLFDKDDDFEYEPQTRNAADEEPVKTVDEEKTLQSPFCRDLLLQPVTVPISDVDVEDEESQVPANPTLLVSRTKQNQSRASGARRLSDLFSVRLYGMSIFVS